MSYRNPQIIVDRSAEIWAQGVAKVGDVLNRGIEAYFAAKKKGEEVQKKKDDAINTTMIQGDLKQSALRNKISKTIKDVTLQEKFTERAKLLADGDGGDNKGAIWYNTQLTLNPPKDKAILKEYKDKVKAYQNYMSNSAQEIGYVASALDMVKDKSAQQLVDNYAVAGDSNISELQNLMAMRALENKALEGFSYEKDLVYNEDGTNSLKVVGYLDKDSKTYNAWKNANAFDEDKLEYDKDGRVKITWERNLAKWGEEGQFVNEISPAIDINSVMEGTGLINKNGSVNDNLYVTPTVQQRLKNQDGTESLTTEKVLDYNKLYNNSAFKAEIQSKAAGLDAISEQDQIDFVRNRFGWGDMKTEDFFSKSREDRLAFYEGQLEMEAVKKLGSFRKATAQDVKTLQEVMPGIKEGDPVIFKEVGRRDIERPKPIKVDESQQKFNDTVSFAVDTLNEVRSLAGETKKQGNKKFTIDEQGAFLTVLNEKRLSTDSKIQKTEDIKSEYLDFKKGEGVSDEDALSQWEAASPKTDLAYMRKGEIIPVDLSNPKAMSKTVLELLNPGIKAQELNKLLKAINIGDKSPKGSKNSFTKYLENAGIKVNQDFN
jgi:hypothetical protein